MTYGVESTDLFLSAEDLSELDQTFDAAKDALSCADHCLDEVTAALTRVRTQRDEALALVKKYEDEAVKFDEVRQSAKTEGVAIGVIVALALYFVSMGFGP